MRRPIMLVSELALAFCVARTTVAQVPTLSPGTRIRVSTADLGSKRLIGVVDSVSGGIITMQLRPTVTATVPVAQVTRLEVLRGEKRPMWSKTAPLWLTASAAALGAILDSETYDGDPVFNREESATIAAIGSGTLGLLIGTGIAIGVKEKHWESVLDVRSNPRTSVAPSLYVAPASRGIALGMRAAF